MGCHKTTHVNTHAIKHYSGAEKCAGAPNVDMYLKVIMQREGNARESQE